jgi:hypothetical protein
MGNTPAAAGCNQELTVGALQQWLQWIEGLSGFPHKQLGIVQHPEEVPVGGEVFCWGKGGRLGTGNMQPSTTPVAVTGGLLYAAIASGQDHTCGRSDDEPSTGYIAGATTRGQLGDGTKTTRLTPTRVNF